MPALDGLRALAVLAVIGYHCGLPFLVGGYYGVDAFLVLSGFLITTLLLGEWASTGTISLPGFWARRARRLLPALFLMLGGVALVVGLWPSVLSAQHLFTDTLASIFYVANWHLAAEHASYFDAYQSPSPLLHTWTLAIEEQFYVIWPILVLGVLSVKRGVPSRWATARARLGVVLVLAVAGTVASALWMMYLAPTGGGDPSRVYYGSDTRAQGLLMGAALAVMGQLWGAVRTTAGRRLLGLVGMVGAAGVAYMWSQVPESSSLAFHGGFLIISLSCAAVVVAAAQAPRSPVGRLLGWGPLRYVGRISYGMYLWYWPVLLVMTGERTGLHGYALLGPRLGVIVALAAGSYHWVETPIRRGALQGWRARLAVPAGAAAAAGAVLLAVTVAPATTVASGLSDSYLTGTPAPPASTDLNAPLDPSSAVAGSSPATGMGSAPSANSSVAAPASPKPSAGAAAPASGAGAVSAASPRATSAPAGVTAGTGRDLTGGVVAAGSPRRPVRIMLVGDSMAGSLGVGLSEVASGYGAEIVNQGQAGCSIAMDGQIKVLWYQIDPGAPCVVGQPDAIVSDMRSWVRWYDPDVVVYLARSEVLNLQVDGQWQYLTQPGMDSWVASRFRALVPVLSSGGAKVVLMTTPYYDTGEATSGDPWPEDAPARVTEDNAIISAVAGATGSRLVDLNGLISPSGRYSTVVDGVDMRCHDGVHFTAVGGRALAARILPGLVRLGLSHALLPSSQARTKQLPPGTPSWYSELPCAS
jgi:peptidoglycan/LPS O-acetylase OafA/YrhL